MIINGSPAGFFKSSKGLRQGDPLYCYLFVLGMEVFLLPFDKAQMGGFLSGYDIRGRNVVTMNISHLLFVDDTLVFCKDFEEQMVSLSWILLCFEALSRLRVNLDKSAILPVAEVQNLNQLACELGCGVGSLPSTCLGLPLGIKQNSASVWEGIGEDFRRRLATWKR